METSDNELVSVEAEEEVNDSLDSIKLRALLEGNFTDCTFLVGPDDGPQEVFG
jgi:hypothetical protein